MANIKNIAIIAHVDHGKTTLVDKIMYHCQLFRENQNTGDLILLILLGMLILVEKLNEYLIWQMEFCY